LKNASGSRRFADINNRACHLAVILQKIIGNGGGNTVKAFPADIETVRNDLLILPVRADKPRTLMP
jgi:hypothetical protein